MQARSGDNEPQGQESPLFFAAIDRRPDAPSGLQQRQLLEPTGNSFVHTVSFVSFVRTAMTEAPLT